MKKQKIVFIASCLILTGISFININIASARVHIKSEAEQSTILKRNVTSNPSIELDVSYLTKRTALSETAVYDLFKKSLSKDDVKICYTIYTLSNKKLDDIVDTYLDENKKVGLTIKDYNLKEEDFNAKFDKLFPKDDETNHDLVDRLKVPYKQVPPKD